jgi:hypothetical protein
MYLLSSVFNEGLFFYWLSRLYTACLTIQCVESFLLHWVMNHVDARILALGKEDN